MKTNQILGIALAGVAIYFFMNKKQSPPPPPPNFNPNTIPNMPQPNTPGWAQWANGIMGVYGAMAWLWAPGGPFYKIPTNDIYDVSDPSTLNQYQWDNPNSLPPGGWA